MAILVLMGLKRPVYLEVIPSASGEAAKAGMVFCLPAPAA
jgi:hypothetical protein